MRESGGGGGGGGFSFPVTPPSDEPDQRLFTSWPSVRSSCTSEPIAIDDDDNALPAEYADDGGSRVLSVTPCWDGGFLWGLPTLRIHPHLVLMAASP